MVILAVLEPPDKTVFWVGVFDLGHIPLFGVVMWLTVGTLQTIRPSMPGSQRIGCAFIATIGLGALTEVIQTLQPTRDASVSDFLRDTAGAGAVALWNGPYGLRLPVSIARARPVLRVLSGALVAAACLPFVVVLDIYLQRNRSFPVLLRFDGSRWEARLTSRGRATLEPNKTAPSREADLGPVTLMTMRPGRYSGLVLEEPYPDWRGYDALVWTVVSENESPFVITIRIHDKQHNQRFDDRFNGKFVLRKGATVITIPLDDIRRAPSGRELDLSHVRGIAVYAQRLQQPTQIYVSALRLIPRE